MKSRNSGGGSVHEKVRENSLKDRKDVFVQKCIVGTICPNNFRH